MMAVVADNRPGTPAFAVAALVLALVTAASVTMIGVTSFTSFNPPDWVRIATMAPFPIALIASVLCAVAAMKRGGRTLGITALGIVVASVGAFAVMLMQGY